jgi:hypothetical protein
LVASVECGSDLFLVDGTDALGLPVRGFPEAEDVIALAHS